MRFIEQVKKLEELVLEKKEVPLRDLVSLLQLSPNYVREVKRQVLKQGKVVEKWLERSDLERYLIEKAHCEELLKAGEAVCD
jgi:predicted transcriptional regulator of viral defense system